MSLMKQQQQRIIVECSLCVIITFNTHHSSPLSVIFMGGDLVNGMDEYVESE